MSHTLSTKVSDWSIPLHKPRLLPIKAERQQASVILATRAPIVTSTTSVFDFTSTETSYTKLENFFLDLKMEYISTALSDSGVVLKIDTSQVKENISKDTDWALHPIWLAYATRLDQSSVMFYLPDLYDALVEITGEDFGYYEAYTSSEEITLYIVGVYKETQPIGPFWHKDLSLPEKGLTDCATKLLKFGKLAQDELELHHEEWDNSLFFFFSFL